MTTMGESASDMKRYRKLCSKNSGKGWSTWSSLSEQMLAFCVSVPARVPGFIVGNIAETILNHIDCSVLAVKPEGFVTPVTLEH